MEDIKRCEELIKEEHSYWIGISNQKAIENLLKQYKELEEEVEQYKMLHLKSVASRVCNDLKTSEKHKEDLEMLYAGCQEELKNSIPISVIQNKIEKFKREFDFYAGREHFEWQDGEFDGEQCHDIALKIGVLKELLEERNK